MASRPALRPAARVLPDEERFVCLATDDGTIVYPASNSKDTNTVTGDPEHPSCTCEPFIDSTGPEFRCVHVDAVFGRLAPPDPEPPQPAAPAARALRAVESPSPAPTPAASPDSAPATMLLKRSISPDGRIDSLSVELSVPVTSLSTSEIKSKAALSLALQGEIAESFLKDRRPTSATPPARPAPTAAPAPQKPAPRPPALDVPEEAVFGTATYAGRTKNQKVFFISIEVDGERYRFFGDRRKVRDILAMLGSDVAQDELWQGVKLDLPCRVTLKESRDGDYTNVDRVFRASDSGGER